MLSEIQFEARLFRDKSTLIIGESGTGKSVVIKDIMYCLRQDVEQAVIICGTDGTNSSYSHAIDSEGKKRPFVPATLIHSKITEELLDNIWQRQEAITATYNRATDVSTLKSLARKCDNNLCELVHRIEVARDKRIREVEGDGPEKEEEREGIKEKASDCIKHIIIKTLSEPTNKKKLSRSKLSEDEQYSLKYMTLNPRLFLAFDDCTEQIKNFRRNEVLQKLFYENRWVYITLVIAAHTDKVLETELKKGAYNTIWTNDKSARSHLLRGSEGNDRESKELSMSAVKQAFNMRFPHQKLIYVRPRRSYYRFTATKRGHFDFCHPAIHSLSKKIEKKQNSIDESNQFKGDFT